MTVFCVLVGSAALGVTTALNTFPTYYVVPGQYRKVSLLLTATSALWLLAAGTDAFLGEWDRGAWTVVASALVALAGWAADVRRRKALAGMGSWPRYLAALPSHPFTSGNGGVYGPCAQCGRTFPAHSMRRGPVL